MNIINGSVKIVLNQYKKENITEEEAITLLNDLYSNTTYNPIVSPNVWPTVTYDNGNRKLTEYQIICNYDNR